MKGLQGHIFVASLLTKKRGCGLDKVLVEAEEKQQAILQFCLLLLPNFRSDFLREEFPAVSA